MVDSIGNSTTPRATAAGGSAAAAKPARPAAQDVSARTVASDTPVITIVSADGAARAAKDAADTKDALATIKAAKAKAAEDTKTFLRLKLDEAKKRLKLLRLWGNDYGRIATGAAELAREIAKDAKEYAKATADKVAADPQAAAKSLDPRDLDKQLEDIKAKAAEAPLGDDDAEPKDAPKDPDELYFYDAYRIINKIKKMVKEVGLKLLLTQGLSSRDGMRKIKQSIAESEESVGTSYKAMKIALAGGGSADATTAATGSSGLRISA
ncbi:MAG: hypothetical protein GC191_08825 [Azospirillum sp.]|nr:hypothetical protein [Azospirillum sp.]